MKPVRLDINSVQEKEKIFPSTEKRFVIIQKIQITKAKTMLRQKKTSQRIVQKARTRRRLTMHIAMMITKTRMRMRSCLPRLFAMPRNFLFPHTSLKFNPSMITKFILILAKTFQTIERRILGNMRVSYLLSNSPLKFHQKKSCLSWTIIIWRESGYELTHL